MKTKQKGLRPMTPKMLRLLQYLKNYSTKHGYMPTFLEMANEMGYNKMLEQLQHN